MTRFLPLLAVLLMAAAPHARAAGDLHSAEAAAREVFARNLAAIEARDGEAYLACYLPTDRLVRNGFGGVLLGFDGLAASTGHGWPDRFEAHDLRVFALTEDVVYGQYRYRVQYADDVREGISERLFVRTAEGWRIAVTTAFDAPEGALGPLSTEPADGDER